MLEVADIFRLHGAAYRARVGNRLLPSQARAMNDIQACRTAYFGGHVDLCITAGARSTSIRPAVIAAVPSVTASLLSGGILRAPKGVLFCSSKSKIFWGMGSRMLEPTTIYLLYIQQPT
jgi:hypothetical protein